MKIQLEYNNSTIHAVVYEGDDAMSVSKRVCQENKELRVKDVYPSI